MRAKRTWLGLAIAILAVLAVGGLVAPPGGADEHKLKEVKDGEVSNQGEQAKDIDYDDEEPVAPESVTTVGDNITVTSKTFKPPTDAWKFKEFPSPNPWQYVDIETDPDALTADVEEEGPDAIQISAAEVEADTAGAWPLKGEGNLEPPPGGEGPLPHWSAKISLVDLDTDTNNNGSIEDSEDEYENYPSGRVVCLDLEGDGKDLDDLAEIRLRVDKSPSGSATLEEIGDKLQVWDNPEKTGDPIISPNDNSESWPVGEVPSQLWVDGVNLGQSTLKLSHGGQFDSVKILVCDPISWSPHGDTFYAYEPSPVLLGVAGSVAIWGRIQSCGWTEQRSYAGLAQCTLARLKEPGNADLNIGIVAYHSLGWHPPNHTYTVEVARSIDEQAMIDWMENESNMYVAQSVIQDQSPNLVYAVKAKAAWFADNWKGTLDANRAIVVMMACNSYPGITGSVGGRSVFGYEGTVLSTSHGPNMALLFGRLNGSLEQTKWRTTKRAYGAGGFQDKLRLHLTPVKLGDDYPPAEPENPQAFWTTLNPAPNKDWSDDDLHYLTFPRPMVYNVGEEGSGCIVFDTYMKEDGQDPKDAVIVLAGLTVYDNRRWFHNGSGKAFLLSFDFKKETAGIGVRAVAEHCLNLDDGERQMSGERLESEENKDWSF